MLFLAKHETIIISKLLNALQIKYDEHNHPKLSFIRSRIVTISWLSSSLWPCIKENNVRKYLFPANIRVFYAPWVIFTPQRRNTSAAFMIDHFNAWHVFLPVQTEEKMLHFWKYLLLYLQDVWNKNFNWEKRILREIILRPLCSHRDLGLANWTPEFQAQFLRQILYVVCHVYRFIASLKKFVSKIDIWDKFSHPFSTSKKYLSSYQDSSSP